MSPERDGRPFLDDAALDLLFRQARTHRAWLDRPVPDDLLRRVYELAAQGPTSANCSPMRVIFARSREAKERLRPALTPGNVDKTMQAPVTAIVAHDLGFPDRLPRLFRSEEHTSELQSHVNLVCRLLLEKKKKYYHKIIYRQLAMQAFAKDLGTLLLADVPRCCVRMSRTSVHFTLYVETADFFKNSTDHY